MGLGSKTAKRQNRPKDPAKLFIRPNPDTLLNLLKLVFFCWDLENIWEVFDVDQKIERWLCATTSLPLLLFSDCLLNKLQKPRLLCIPPSLNVLPRPWKSINWVMLSSIWTISTAISYCIVVQYPTMQYHMHVLTWWNVALRCNIRIMQKQIS